MKIEQCCLSRLYEKFHDEYDCAYKDVMSGGMYINGNNVQKFEAELASYIGAEYCIGVGNGTDALCIAMKALGVKSGDEVLLPANGFVSDYIAVYSCGAVPVSIDITDDFNINANLIEEKITDRTKAIIALHLYGTPCDIKKLQLIAKKHNLFIIEDCAQSLGSTFNGRMTGSFGDIACFSFYPTKNLGAFGDGGAIVTNSENLAQKCRNLVNYGSEDRVTFDNIGQNSRLDELQAAFLRVTLSHINELKADRSKAITTYLDGIKNKNIILPDISSTSFCHQFVIKANDRTRLIEYLTSLNIGTKIHYEKPVYLSPAYSFMNCGEKNFPKNTELNRQILSLPLFFGMTEEETAYIINALNNYE